MRLLNRTGVSLTPTEELWCWLERCSGEAVAPEQRQGEEASLYLVPECDSDEEVRAYLAAQADRVLANELEGFWPERTAWPQPLDFALLQHFFRLQTQVVCFDLCDRDLLVADIPEVL